MDAACLSSARDRPVLGQTAACAKQRVQFRAIGNDKVATMADNMAFTQLCTDTRQTFRLQAQHAVHQGFAER